MMLTPRTYPTQTFIWLSRNLSRACHANILQRNDSKDFWAKKKKTQEDGGYACLFAQAVPHKSKILHK